MIQLKIDQPAAVKLQAALGACLLTGPQYGLQTDLVEIIHREQREKDKFIVRVRAQDTGSRQREVSSSASMKSHLPTYHSVFDRVRVQNRSDKDLVSPVQWPEALGA